MSVTLWIDTDAEKTVDLGGTLPCYKAFAEMSRAAGDSWEEDYPDLAGVLTQCETQDDADTDWLRDVYDQAKAFLTAHRDDVDEATAEMVAHLAIEIEPHIDKGKAR